MWIILAICTLAVALVCSMLGQGGGSLYTPLQVLFGIDFHQAATTSLFLIIVTSISASLVFHKAKKIDWPLAIVLEAVTAVGGFAGGLGSDWFSGTALSVVFAIVITSAAIFMVRPVKENQPGAHLTKGFFCWERTLGEQSYSVNLALALPVSFVAGITCGMIGIGGGVIKVPMMVLVLGMPMDIAIGSSALMVGLTASGGLAGHLINGHWDWRTSLLLAAAVFIGGQVGSRLTVKLDEGKLKKGFGWLMIIIAATMIYKVLK